MTAPDHTTKPLENILRERGHPYMDLYRGLLNAGYFDFVAASRGLKPDQSRDKVNDDGREAIAISLNSSRISSCLRPFLSTSFGGFSHSLQHRLLCSLL